MEIHVFSAIKLALLVVVLTLVQNASHCKSLQMENALLDAPSTAFIAPVQLSAPLATKDLLSQMVNAVAVLFLAPAATQPILLSALPAILVSF